MCYKKASHVAYFDSLFRHKFTLKAFPGHFQSFLIYLGKVCCLSLLLTFLCQHLSPGALPFALNSQVGVDVASNFGKNWSTSDHVETSRESSVGSFAKPMSSRQIYMLPMAPKKSCIFLISHSKHNLAEEKALSPGSDRAQMWTLLSRAPLFSSYFKVFLLFKLLLGLRPRKGSGFGRSSCWWPAVGPALFYSLGASEQYFQDAKRECKSKSVLLFHPPLQISDFGGTLNCPSIRKVGSFSFSPSPVVPGHSLQTSRRATYRHVHWTWQPSPG